MTRLAFATLVALGFGVAARAQQAPAPLHDTPHLSFKEADQNGDGRVNRGEANAVNGLDFALADTNGDRVLTRQEFSVALSAAAAGGERTVATGDTAQVPFEQADKNQDGKVDLEEAQELDGFNFAAADSDDDRELTRAEYRTAMLDSERQRG